MSRISVLMPVYNTPEEYVREAIESILQQTYGDFEFIIVNDGSTNNAEEVILSYADERIRYYFNAENKGVIVTRNRLVAQSTGEYLALMDADDISLPFRFARQVQFLEEHPEVGVLGAGVEYFPSGKLLKRHSSSELIKQELLFRGCALANPSVMIRRSLDIHYDESYRSAEDYILWLNLLGKTEFANIPEVLVQYRWHGGNLSCLHSEEQEGCARRVRLLAQQQRFHCDEQFIDCLSLQQYVRVDDFNKLRQFLGLMGEYAALHRRAYKQILSKLELNRHYLSVIWFLPLNKTMKIKFLYKIKCTLRVLRLF